MSADVKNKNSFGLFQQQQQNAFVVIPANVIDEAFGPENEILNIVPHQEMYLRKMKNFTLLLTADKSLDIQNNEKNLFIPYWISIFRVGGQIAIRHTTNNNNSSNNVLGYSVSNRRWSNLMEWIERINARNNTNNNTETPSTTTNNNIPQLSSSTIQSGKSLPKSPFFRFVPLGDFSLKILTQSTFSFDGNMKNRIPIVAGIDLEKIKTMKIRDFVEICDEESSGAEQEQQQHFFSIRFKNEKELEALLGVQRCVESENPSLMFQPRLPWLKWAKGFALTFNRLGGQLSETTATTTTNSTLNPDPLQNPQFHRIIPSKLEMLQTNRWVFPSCVRKIVVDEYLNNCGWVLEK
jgi:hypothetical protein